jgi:PPK2 family polyphosphate:nucleotide phosphotransferase
MDKYRVKPGGNVDLSDAAAAGTDGFDGTKEDALRETLALNDRLEKLQELLSAEGRHRVLIVLQAMDTGGKDGVVRHVFEGVNPQGVRVAAFKVPTSNELAHDYLWRVHPHVPGNGEMVIFNRSHYEDLLVVRVAKLASETVWSRRFDHINAFERMLADEGTTILKFFLHISKDEQRKRLQARLDDPTKRWKFRLGDLETRAQWGDYMRAYADVLTRTSTDRAPWYLVPADHKWFRDLVISRIVVDALEGLGMGYPKPDEDLTGVVVN